ncbi:MAG: hypothetical protein LBG44_10860 [Gemmatimonadota bacterium]|jgi:hypothetical protein|nr:hypothetical protein [Gemmatimonadota bacterium]
MSDRITGQFDDPAHGRPAGSDDGTTNPGGTIALRGCLFGSVALFVVMFLLMIFLAYRQFRDHTGSTAPDTPPASIYP